MRVGLYASRARETEVIQGLVPYVTGSSGELQASAGFRKQADSGAVVLDVVHEESQCFSVGRRERGGVHVQMVLTYL